MKRILCYTAILAIMLALPVEKADVGNLRPVQVVAIYKENNWFVMETDTEDKGYGGTPEQALQNLKDTSSGIIYLDTAEYLLLTKDTLDAAEELRQELKNSVRLCMTAKPVDLTEVAEYLSVHGNLPKLKAWGKDQELPVLSVFGDSLIFFEKSRKKFLTIGGRSDRIPKAQREQG